MFLLNVPQSKGTTIKRLKNKSITAKERKVFNYSSQRKQTLFLFSLPSHLDALNGLSDVLQQRLVLRALVLILVSVHVCQGADISVKVLFIHWLL